MFHVEHEPLVDRYILTVAPVARRCTDARASAELRDRQCLRTSARQLALPACRTPWRLPSGRCAWVAVRAAARRSSLVDKARWSLAGRRARPRWQCSTWNCAEVAAVARVLGVSTSAPHVLSGAYSPQAAPHDRSIPREGLHAKVESRLPDLGLVVVSYCGMATERHRAVSARPQLPDVS